MDLVRAVPGARGVRSAPPSPGPGAPRCARLRPVGRGRRGGGGLLYARGYRRPPLPCQEPHRMALLRDRPRRGGAAVLRRVRRLRAAGAPRIFAGRGGGGLGRHLAVDRALRPVRVPRTTVPRRPAADASLAALRVAARGGNRAGGGGGGILARAGRQPR